MSFKVCSKPGCPNILYGTGQCTDCIAKASQGRRESNAPYKTKAHQGFRLEVLDRDPICVLCHLRPSHHADHHPRDRKTLVQLGFDPNDPAHGRGLCASCHSKATAEHQPGGWNNRD